MRKPVIAGNWKMHMTCAQARDWMGMFLPLIAELPDDRHLVVAPPFTAISTLAELSHGTRLELSSQNVHWEGEGAYTAEISPKVSSALEAFGIPRLVTGLVLGVLVFAVIIGGIDRIIAIAGNWPVWLGG